MGKTYTWLEPTHERGEDRKPIRVIADLRARKEEILTRIKEAREALGIREEALECR